MISNDEVMLDQIKCWRCLNSDVADIKLTNLKKESPSSQDKPLTVTYNEVSLSESLL